MWKTCAQSHRFGLGRVVGGGGIPLVGGGGGGRRTENPGIIYRNLRASLNLFLSALHPYCMPPNVFGVFLFIACYLGTAREYVHEFFRAQQMQEAAHIESRGFPWGSQHGLCYFIVRFC